MYKVSLFLVLIIVFLESPAQPDSAFVKWAKANAHALQPTKSATSNNDLHPIKQMIGNARIVALGESSHGMPEPINFRNRLFKYLAENCGFTTIVLEAGLGESRLAMDYVANGTGTPEAAAAALSIAPPSSANIELLKWIRTYNASHKQQLKFIGMDMQVKGFPNDTTPAHASLDQALSYLKQVDTAAFGQINAGIQPFLNKLSVKNYPALSETDKNKLSTTLDELISIFERQRLHFVAASNQQQYEWAYRCAIAASQTNRMIRVMPPDKPGGIPADAWKVMNVRDAAMAANAQWILNTQANGGKVLLFAHNGHVKNTPTKGGVWDAFAIPPNSAGEYLRAVMGKDIFIIGSSIAPSINTAQPGSIDRALVQVGKPAFILNLQSAGTNPAVAAWLAQTRAIEANQHSFNTLPISTAFDALVFFDKGQF